MEGKKVLHLDRNNYYGGECASLSLSKVKDIVLHQYYNGSYLPILQLFEQFKSEGYDGSTYGKDRDYNIDIVPKFLLAAGELVDILVHTDVTRYLEFQQIAGSFVYRQGSGICKVPATEYEALTSPLMGFFEKRRAGKFFQYVQNIREDDPTTWEGRNLTCMAMEALYKEFGLEEGTQDFIGHALALYLDEGYLKKSALDACIKIRLYMRSMLRFGKSPYVYPLYGLGELPQAFARLSAIYGGTYMLGIPVDEILFDSNTNKVKGIRSGDKEATCDVIVADPSYILEKTRLAHKVIRAICLLDHPIPNTSNSDSCQIIIPQRQLNRKYDVYIACVSSFHNVCASGYYIAMISTIIETDQPEKEIEFALSLLGPIREKFIRETDMLEPLDDGRNTGLFIAKSYDATSHFETVCDDVKDLYERYAGKKLQMKKRPTADEEQKALGQSHSGVHDV